MDSRNPHNRPDRAKRWAVPLHSKSDWVLLPVVVVFFLSAPVWALAEGRYGLAATTALALGWFVWWSLRLGVCVLGTVAEIDEHRLRVLRKEKELWSINWRDVENVLIPTGDGLHFVNRSQSTPKILRDVLLPPLVGAELRELIRRQLPPGVEMSRRVIGEASSRRPSLILGLLCTFGGIYFIALGLDWLVPDPEPSALQLRLASISIWLAIAGMIGLGIGVVKVVGYFAWRPHRVDNKLLNLQTYDQSLLTALKIRQKGSFVPERIVFAYPEKTRTMDVRRQAQQTWAVIIFFCLFWISLAIYAHVDEARNAKSSPEGMLFVDAMIVVIVGGAVGLTAHSLRRERRLAPFREVRVVIKGKQLFAQEGTQLQSARICLPPRSTFLSRTSSSLGFSLLHVEGGGKTYVFDPLSMFREVGSE